MSTLIAVRFVLSCNIWIVSSTLFSVQSIPFLRLLEYGASFF